MDNCGSRRSTSVATTAIPLVFHVKDAETVEQLLRIKEVVEVSQAWSHEDQYRLDVIEIHQEEWTLRLHKITRLPPSRLVLRFRGTWRDQNGPRPADGTLFFGRDSSGKDDIEVGIRFI